MSKRIYDIFIIGGGAAGLCTAVALKQMDRSLNIAIAEQLPRVGKKLITTGNGRCNITNSNIDISRFHSENPDFVQSVIDRYDNIYTETFFADLGIVITYDEQGRAYPYSLQASSVVDALRFGADDMGVEVLLETEVLNINKNKEVYEIETQKGVFCAKTVVLAAGLFSGGKKLGSSGKMFKLLQSKGYKTVKITPAIVQLKTVGDVAKSLKGMKVNAIATLMINDKKVRTDFGEVLFCDYGLSGPPIMQISREVERKDGKKTIVLDLMPEYSFSAVTELLEHRTCALRGRTLEDYLSGMLNKRVGQAILKLAGRKLGDRVDDLNSSDLKRIASLIKGMTFEICGTTGFENSQVTAGGISTDEFYSDNLMSKRDSGLFAVGEILDIDGDCGGFNLQWAWSSSFCAAEGIAKYLGLEIC